MSNKLVDLNVDEKLFGWVNKLDALVLALRAESPTERQLWGVEHIVCEVRDDLDRLKDDLSEAEISRQ